MSLFFAVWAGERVFFLLFGRGACSLFAVWAGSVFFFFSCLGRGRVFFCCLGRGEGWKEGGGGVLFLFCCLGGGQEFTHLPVCLARL